MSKHYQLPGMDLISGLDTNVITPKLNSSVAHLFDRKRNLAETFGAFGWDLSMEEMKRTVAWEVAGGVDLIDNHAFYYSIDGQRRYESQPSEFFQNTFWPRFDAYTSFTGRLVEPAKGSHAGQPGRPALSQLVGDGRGDAVDGPRLRRQRSRPERGRRLVEGHVECSARRAAGLRLSRRTRAGRGPGPRRRAHRRRRPAASCTTRPSRPWSCRRRPCCRWRRSPPRSGWSPRAARSWPSTACRPGRRKAGTPSCVSGWRPCSAPTPPNRRRRAGPAAPAASPSTCRPAPTSPRR